jgi:hypothetical protein
MNADSSGANALGTVTTVLQVGTYRVLVTYQRRTAMIVNDEVIWFFSGTGCSDSDPNVPKYTTTHRPGETLVFGQTAYVVTSTMANLVAWKYSRWNQGSCLNPPGSITGVNGYLLQRIGTLPIATGQMTLQLSL